MADPLIRLTLARSLIVGSAALLALSNPVLPDQDAGVELYERACSEGKAQSCLELGMLYKEGFGVGKDLFLAMHYIQRSCDLDSAANCTAVIPLYQSACEIGHYKSCHNLALLYRNAGHRNAYHDPRVIALYDRACAEQVAESCFNLGQIYRKGELGLSPNPEKATEFYKRACDAGLAEGCHNYSNIKHADILHRAEALVREGKLISHTGNYRDAIVIFENALALFEEINHREGLSMSLQGLGICYRNVGKLDVALIYHQRALQIDQLLNREDLLGADHYDLGVDYLELLRPDEALTHFRKALQIIDGLSDTRFEAVTYGGIGNAYFDQGLIFEAIDNHERSLDLYSETMDIRGLGIASLNLGNIYLQMGDYERALARYEAAFSASERSESKLVKAMALGNIGATWLAIGDLEQARSALVASWQILASLHADSRLVTILTWLLEVEIASDNRVAAEEVVRIMNDPFYSGLLSFLSGDLMGARRGFSDALIQLESEARSGSSFDTEVSARIGLGLVAEATGDLKGAYRDFATAAASLEQLRSRGPVTSGFFSPRFRGFGRLEAFEGLVRVAQAAGDLEEAFLWSERTKARSLLDGMAKVNLSKGQKGSLSGGLPYRPVSASELALAAEEVLIEYEVTEAATLVFVVKKGGIVATHRIDVERKELQSLVRRFRQPFERVAESRRLEELRSFDLELGHRLYRLVLRDALGSVESGERVVIVPDEILGLLPFEALIERLAEGPIRWLDFGYGKYPENIEYVGNRNVFSYWQSASALTAFRARYSGNLNNRVLVIADPDTDDSRQDTEAEDAASWEARTRVLKAIQLRLGWEHWPSRVNLQDFGMLSKQEFGRDLDLLMGSESSETTVRKAVLEEHGLGIVFATHGIIDERIPYLKQPALVVGRPMWHPKEGDAASPLGAFFDGLLTSEEIMELSIPTEVVAALACRTGIGEIIPGEGVMNLARAFQLAGARSVLVSLWSVEDKSTNSFTLRFLTGLRNGEDKDIAILAARKLVRGQGYEHPYYWASFALAGERNQLSRDLLKKSHLSSILVVGIFILIVFALIAATIVWEYRDLRGHK